MGGHSLVVAAGKRRLGSGLRSGVVRIRKHTTNFFASLVADPFQVPRDPIASGAKREFLLGKLNDVVRLSIFIVDAIPDVPPGRRVTGQHELYPVRLY